MTYRKSILLLGLVLLVGVGGYFGVRFALGPARMDRLSPSPPADHAARTTTGEAPASAHPLDPALEIARNCLENIQENIRDYSATMVKQERIGDKLADPETMFVKIRQEPLSVYIYFKAPESIQGQEALYVEGQNDGNMLAHGVGIQGLIGIVSLKPDGLIAMRGQRYPITEIGILNLTRRLIEAAEQDRQHDECEVNFYKDAKINGRPCTTIEVVHPEPRPYFRFHLARVFIDDEMNIPVRYEAYEWPDAPGGQPRLLEEYTYLDVKLNNGFTDADFKLD